MLWVVIRIDHPCLSIIAHSMPVVGERDPKIDWKKEKEKRQKRRGEKRRRVATVITTVLFPLNFHSRIMVLVITPRPERREWLRGSELSKTLKRRLIYPTLSTRGEETITRGRATFSHAACALKVSRYMGERQEREVVHLPACAP